MKIGNQMPITLLVFVLAAVLWSPVLASAQITAVWVNDGGDKVTRDELRAGSSPENVVNSVWDGTKVILFGAKNEIVAFNLVLEASSTVATNITLSFNQLTGPGSASIESSPTSGDGVFDWTSRDIELFYIRYLEIEGLSVLSYEFYDERHIPERFRRPWTGDGEGTGTWSDRPDHNKFYPDIAVPLELVPNFGIAAGQNQSIWVDIYIPKNIQAGLYTGSVTISENGATTYQIPVELTVRDFTLPDIPHAKTMIDLGYEDVNLRYLGEEYPSPSTDNDTASKLIRDRHFLIAHRHRVSLIDANEGSTNWELDQPRSEWIPRLDGSLFTSAHGYDGPGLNTGNDVYSIGTYGSWGWQGEGEAGMRLHTDAWVDWFETHSPDTEHFLYLIDESDDFQTTEQWATWINNNPGSGSRLMSMATIPLPDAAANTPSLDIPTSWDTIGITAAWQSAADQWIAAPDKRLFLYNGVRPGSGSFAIEDDGVALRQLAWGQYKKKIDRWFFWEATYYNNFQGNTGQTNVFQTAQTYGNHDRFDNVVGETGWNYSNGDGLLFYPGTDLVYPEESYGVKGPFASLRLKHWRRGIQDVDYLAMAASINPARVQQILDQMIPTVLWEYGVTDPDDPTWVLTDISWPTDPDLWETARAELADMIEQGPPGLPTIAVDFGPSGLWHYEAGTWTRISSGDADGLANHQGDLVADFDTYGLYLYDGAWTRISTGNAEDMIGRGTILYIDFGNSGLWKYSVGTWTRISTGNAEGMRLFGNNLVADFGSYGLYEYDGSTWTRISTGNADGDGGVIGFSSDLYVDFGGSGLWRYDGVTWTRISTGNADGLSGYNNKLVADFGTYGLYLYDGAWARVSTGNGEDIIQIGSVLYVDFGSAGLWKYDGIIWTRISSGNAEGLGFYGTKLLGDFGTHGLYEFDATWTRISNDNCEDMEEVDIY